MKLGFARFTASSNKNKRLAIVFIILSGLLITMCAAYGISGQRRVQGPRTSTQNPNRRGRAIRAKTSSTRKGVESCSPPPSGLVSWYRGEGDAKDFQATNQGAANGVLSFVPGKVGQAFKFDGSNGVDIPDSASLRPSALSIDGWIRPNFAGRPRFTADFDTIFEKMDTNHDGYILAVTQDPTFIFGAGGPFPNGTIAFQVNIGGTRQAVYSTSVIPNDSQFHHVAATYDGAFLRVYLDGNPVGQQTVGNAIVHSTGPAHIGLSTSSGVKNSLAAIDEVDLFNRALSDIEVSQIFSADGDGKCTVNQSPIYFENFEAGDGGYTSVTSTGPFGWTNTTNCDANLAGHSLSHAFRFGNPANCNDYGIGVRDAANLSSVPIDLTNASGTLVLEFEYLLKTDSAAPSAATDKARVDLYEADQVGVSFIRTAASNRQNATGPILGLQDAGPAGTPQWNDIQIDVSDFAHKKLILGFFFDTIDGTNNNLDGWLIDDVQVRSDSDLTGGGTELLHENFERGLDGFTEANQDNGVEWLTTTDCGGVSAGGHSQSTIVRMGRSSFCDYDVGQSSDATLTSPDIDLTAAGAQAILSFNYYLSTESNAADLNADIARVRISKDNFATSQILATNRTDLVSNAELLFDAADSALPRNFSRSIIDISGFIGNHVKIRWEFDTVDALNNAFPGWAIDDVVIRAGVTAPTPVISAVNPSGGSPFGGEQVTITGSGFAAAGTPNPPLVFFGNNQALNVVVTDDNDITCLTPAGQGTVKVSIITANGQTREDVFYTYFPPPEVDSVSPTFGVTTGGTHVTVSGLNFDPSGIGQAGSGGTNVMFAESPGTNVVVVNDNTITVDSPPGTGIVDVVVNNGNGVSNTGVKFQYFPVIVTSISPTVGPEAGGTNFTVSGFGDPNANTTGVTFGGKPATNIVVGPSTITGKTPSGTGQVPVVVQSSMGDSNANILFTYQPQPLANSVTAVMTTYLAGNLGIVLPNPDVNLPTPTQTVINGLPAGAHPYGAAFATSDHVLISDFGASRVFVVQISNNSVISTIDTSPDYSGRGTIAVSPNRTFGLFANGPTLYVKPAPVDVAGPHTTVTLPGNVEDFRKQAIAFDFNGRAFVYNSTGISVLDAPYTSVAFTIPFANSGGGIAINSSGNRLLVTDFTDTVKIFNAPFSTASVPTTVIFPGGPHLSGVAVSPDSSTALVSEFHTPRLFTMVLPFNPTPQILEDVLPPGLASSPFGFSDLSMSADGQFAIGTGNDAADTAQPAAFIEAPFDNPRIFAVNITGGGRGDGVARFLPPGLAPGLTITKSAPSTVPSLGNMTYTLSYANTGAVVIPDVQIKDTVPAGTTFVSAANGGANNFGTVAWSVGDVAPNTSGTVSFTVNVTAAQGATITNSSYSAQGDVGSVVTGPPVSTTVTAVAAGPDLSIQKTHTGNFTVGIDGFYTINVTNVGSSSTTGTITVTDVLPAGLTFISNTGSGTCSAVSQTVTCQMTVPLTATQGEAVTLRVAVASAASPSVTNTATVSTAGDSNSANDSSSDPTTVNKSAELALSFSVSSNSVQAGTNVTYTIGVTNNGPSPATGVTVTAPLPGNVTFVSGNFSQGTCTANTTAITCAIGNIASGAATVNGTIVVKPIAGPSFQAVVNLSGNEPDPNSGNNSASTTIGVTPPPPPIVSSINPTTGAEAGGTSVTITGSNFATFNAGTTSVTFGGSLATSVVVVGDTSITCVTPSGKGQVPVVVSNNNGTSNATVIFTYQLSPLANANPAILTTVGTGNLAIVFPRPDLNLPTPTQNNVSGPANGVQPQGVAYFGSDNALVADANNSRIFVVKISTAAVLDTISTAGKFDGSGTIAVAPSLNFALASGSTTSLAVIKAPFNSSSVVNTVPLPGSISGFQTEAIVFDATGRAFVYTTAGISVLDAPYTSVAFTIPVSNANSGALAITPNGQTLLATTFSNTVSVFSSPFSSGSVATSLPVSGATSLDGIAVTPDGNTALVADRSTPKVFAIAAPFAGGSAVQSLSMPPGIGTAGFEDIGISADGQLAIAAGGDASGSPALFIGAPFTSAGARTFAVNINGGGRGAGAVRFLPPGLAPGLTISKTGPATVATNANFNYTINFANTGQTNATNVIVKDPIPAGATFVSASNGGTLVNGVATWNLGNVPAGASGTLTLTVSTTLTSGTVNNVNYTIEGTGVSPIPGPPVTTPIVNNQPIVKSITPNVGATAGNTAVVISGQNFKAVGAGTNTVKFGSASATNVSVVDDQTITAVSPAGTGTVSVTVVNGNGTSNSDVTFTYTSAQLFLQVSEISPAQAPENGGTPVKITGIGFGSGNSLGTAVLIGGKPATNVIVVNDTEVDAVVPAGTGIVNVSVSNSLGSSTLVGGFTYVKPLLQNIEIDWHAPSDPTQQLAPPRDTSSKFTTNSPANGGDGISQQISAQALPSADATTFVIAYNVYRGFTPDFSVNASQPGGEANGTQALSPGVTQIATIPANQLTMIDTAAALAAAQANGFGTPFYKVTAVYQTPTGIQSSQASIVAAPLPLITAVSVVNSGTGKIIRIDGVGFASFRAILEINGTQFTTLAFPPAQRLENGTAGRIELQDNTGNLIPIGAQVTITVLNPGLTPGSGNRSAAFIFRRLN